MDIITAKKIAEYLEKICDRYISYRPRTEYEFRRYITSKFKSQKFIKRFDTLTESEQSTLLEATIAKLKDIAYINDAAFAKWYIQEKNDFKPRGVIRLTQELKQKGLSQSVISHALEKYSESPTELLKKLIPHRFTAVMFEDEEFKRKFIQKLLRKGFRYPDIILAIEEFTQKE